MVAIERVLERHASAWTALPGVVGTGIGLADGRPCITVLVAHSSPELLELIPAEVDGHPIRIVESGTVRAQDK